MSCCGSPGRLGGRRLHPVSAGRWDKQPDLMLQRDRHTVRVGNEQHAHRHEKRCAVEIERIAGRQHETDRLLRAAEAARLQPDTLISSLIEARYGRCITEIQQDVHAALISQEMAERLKVAKGTAALEIVRRYLDSAGETFEVSISVHPAERFSVSMRLKRSDA